MNVYQAKMSTAHEKPIHLEDMPWVETDREVMEAVMPHIAIHKEKYFVFEGVFVCETGKRQEILDHASERLEKRIHGDKEAVFDR